ncbi:DUF1700 domain-containing protein [Schnuerera sp. xch1]|uniref:DUF1700 domain-containing protein n=1 Tax=Schnuerera sp. xch1 TaxID=2874283 RepID=UPI001CBB93BA|nr:DUF1700 domain-containing protein [Schnuerera sp. xch1]MBZ2174021.1 DUF1700 domain-containing protein [Schnuerera sp. xch1]
MNKEQFLKTLNSDLKRLPSNEREDIIRDFEEHFLIGFKEGNSEEEISEALGSPKQVAKELLATYHLEKANESGKTREVLHATWAILGLGLLNLILVLGPFILLTGIMVASWTLGIAFIISPLLVVINEMVNPGTLQSFFLFFSIMLSGVGFFIVVGMKLTTSIVIRGFIKYLKFNMNIVKGGYKNE